MSPDAGLLRRADVIVTTPEKWDGVSRSWRQRAYVRQIALIVIDEIHMVGEERGPILEVRLSCWTSKHSLNAFLEWPDQTCKTPCLYLSD